MHFLANLSGKSITLLVLLFVMSCGAGYLGARAAVPPTPIQPTSTPSSLQVSTIPLGTAVRPTATLKSPNYSANPGQEITFDASDSHTNEPDELVKYEWDFTSDGTYDQTTSTPTIDYAYAKEFNGIITVRVTTKAGRTATATANVAVAHTAPPQLPAAPQNLKAVVTSTSGDTSTVLLTWTTGDTTADTWLLRMNDFPLGYLEKSRRSIEITDVDRTEDVIITLTAQTKDKEDGDTASVTIKKR